MSETLADEIVMKEGIEVFDINGHDTGIAVKRVEMNNSNTELKNILKRSRRISRGRFWSLVKKVPGESAFRWLSKGVCDFDEMSNLSKTFREKLKEHYCIDIPRVIYDQQSRTDGTQVPSSNSWTEAGTVFMKYSYGNPSASHPR